VQERITLLSNPSVEPVTLADAKAWLRVDTTDDDALITGLIPAARTLCEAIVKKTFVQQQYAWSFDYFPNRLVVTPATVVWDSWLNSRLYPYTYAQQIYVPRPPLISVDSITFYDVNNVQQTLASNQYLVELGTPGRISPLPGSQWPMTADRLYSATVNFTSGEGNSASAIQANEVLAIKQLVAHFYRNREAVIVGATAADVPLGVRSLLGASRWGFYA
jgi:uncharacterized phiE125 gp8 family phage protein